MTLRNVSEPKKVRFATRRRASALKLFDHGRADLVGASRGAHATREQRQQVVGVRRLDVGVGLDRLDGKARGGEQAGSCRMICGAWDAPSAVLKRIVF